MKKFIFIITLLSIYTFISCRQEHKVVEKVEEIIEEKEEEIKEEVVIETIEDNKQIPIMPESYHTEYKILDENGTYYQEIWYYKGDYRIETWTPDSHTRGVIIILPPEDKYTFIFNPGGSYTFDNGDVDFEKEFYSTYGYSDGKLPYLPLFFPNPYVRWVEYFYDEELSSSEMPFVYSYLDAPNYATAWFDSIVSSPTRFEIMLGTQMINVSVTIFDEREIDESIFIIPEDYPEKD